MAQASFPKKIFQCLSLPKRETLNLGLCCCVSAFYDVVPDLMRFEQSRINKQDVRLPGVKWNVHSATNRQKWVNAQPHSAK